MKLPVRFGRILFLGSPGASSRVRAKVRHFSDDILEGDIGIYESEENPACWWTASGPSAFPARAAPLLPAARAI